MNGTASVNLSQGGQRLCPTCKGLKVLAETSYSPAGTCYGCNGTGRTQALRNTDSQGLPPNNQGSCS